MAISVYWTLFAIFLIGRETTQGSNDFMDTALFSKMKKELDNMCPKVDICNRNASEPTILPNGLIADNYIACCEEENMLTVVRRATDADHSTLSTSFSGCSCHEDCYENMNCCFQDDDDDKSGVDKYSSMECLSVQTGTPDETSTTTVPAYRIVTSAPREGCITYMRSESPIKQGLTPSCGAEPVVKWGNLLPVYSQEHDKIYKNAQCALCHNAINVVPWLSIFKCNDDKNLPQLLQTLVLNNWTSNCYVTFNSRDPSILATKRCYHELVSTCKTQIDTISTREETHLSPAEIREACESGLESTFSFRNIAYRNIYCYFCNVQQSLSPFRLQSECTIADTDQKLGSNKLSVLLDADNFKMINQDGRSDEKIVFPQACVSSGQSLASERCRNILCPSGQIRRTLTDCKFLSTKWFVDSVLITLRLSYPNSQDNIFTLFKQGIVKRSDVEEGLLENTPWPTLWKMITVLHTNESNSQKSLIINMMSETNTPAILFHSIKRSVAKSWTVTLNGSSFIFKQSFCEYSVTPVGTKPVWILWANSTSLQQMNISNTESHTLHAIYQARIKSRPRTLNKLFVCEQISLYRGEFNLLANKFVLISNLTVRALYDREFELVYDADKTVTARVCASDTVFKTKNATNGSLEALLVRPAISITLVVFVWIFV